MHLSTLKTLYHSYIYLKCSCRECRKIKHISIEVNEINVVSVENMADISIEVNEINVVSVENMADISIEVNEINVVSVENMADISIEVNEINVVSVERSIYFLRFTLYLLIQSL